MRKLAVLASLATIACMGEASIQGYFQPWTPGLSSWGSTVYSCGQPTIYNSVALDDFVLPSGQAIGQINWWGAVANSTQPGRPFYIAIYNSDTVSRCRPALQDIVWSGCVVPSAQAVGQDCPGRTIWKFSSNLPGPLFLTPGLRYWLQISDSYIDAISTSEIVPPTFWWASHQDVVNCPALQIRISSSQISLVQPLIDPCNQMRDDMAFEIL